VNAADAALVVTELFGNAIRHGPAGGRVLVGYSLWQQDARLVVCDGGGPGTPRLVHGGELAEGGRVARVQYGINFRGLDGSTYSAPGPPDAIATRNLGIVMEGATDTEATTIARQAAATAGITGMAGPASVARHAFADTTGTLTTTAIEDARAAAHPYLRALAGFNRDVTGRYRALVRQLADDRGELHRQFVTAMISGDLTELEQ